MEAARALLRQWNDGRLEALEHEAGLTAELGEFETWLLEQNLESLAEAERLLELIVSHEGDEGRGLEPLCRIGGGVRNDIAPHRSRIEHSFAPRASGPLAGRA